MLIISMGVSADGYINDRDGGFAWGPPDPVQFRQHLEGVEQLGAYVLGRKLYEMMRVWETDPGYARRRRRALRGCLDGAAEARVQQHLHSGRMCCSPRDPAVRR